MLSGTQWKFFGLLGFKAAIEFDREIESSRNSFSEQGKSHYAKQNYKLASDYFNKAISDILRLKNKIKQNVDLYSHYHWLSSCYQHLGDQKKYHETESKKKRTLTFLESQALDDEALLQLMQALNAVGDFCREAEQLHEAVKCYQQVQVLAGEKGVDLHFRTVTHALKNIGLIYKGNYSEPSSINYFNEAIEALKKITKKQKSDLLELVTCYALASDYYYNHHEWELALTAREETIRYLDASGDAVSEEDKETLVGEDVFHKELADQYECIAKINHALRCYPEEIVAYQEAYRLKDNMETKDKKDKQQLADYSMSIGNLYVKQRNFQEAPDWFSKAILHLDSLPPKDNVIWLQFKTYRKLYFIYSSLNDIEQMEIICTKAIESAEQLKSPAQYQKNAMTKLQNTKTNDLLRYKNTISKMKAEFELSIRQSSETVKQQFQADIDRVQIEVNRINETIRPQPTKSSSFPGALFPRAKLGVKENTALSSTPPVQQTYSKSRPNY